MSDSFPAEIIREIMLKSSVKSLLRCKAVCKEWYSLISDHDFIKSHYKYNLSSTSTKHNHKLIFNTYKQRNNLLTCPLSDFMFTKSVSNAQLLENPLQLPKPHEIKIVGSCNGLLCIFVPQGLLYIYNPSTRVCNPLHIFRLNLPNRCFSFGYDQSTDDFKIVETRITKCRIYSLKTGNWKGLDDFPSKYDSLHACGIFSNGALHWLAAYDFLRDTQRIVSLDLEKETYGEFLQPEYDDEYSKTLTLGILGEWLCVFCYYNKTRADLWVMKEYGVKESWTKLASFSYLGNPGIGIRSTPLCISNDGKVLFNSCPYLVIYDSKHSSSKQTEYVCKIFEASTVVESLVSPFPPFPHLSPS